MLDPRYRSHREPSLQIGKFRRPGGRQFIRDHHQRPARVLRLVPGVEQFLFIALLGLIEQAPPNPFHEAAGKKRAARPPWPRQDRRLDWPHVPLAEMLERFAVSVRDDEPGISVAE